MAFRPDYPNMNNLDALRAYISEIFSSIQGEGPFIGIKQIFIKFAECNLRCRFCDIDASFPPKEFSAAKLLSVVKQICENSGDHHSVSLTGGEPLLHVEFLKGFLPEVRKTGLKIYLETNATMPTQLTEIIEFVDIVAADIKLPSSTGNKAFWNEHAEFIKIAGKKNCFVKVVITNDTTQNDIKKAINIIRKVNKNLLLVLQPVSPAKGVEKPSSKLLIDYLFMAEKRLGNVRILPQIHKILGVR